MEDWLNNDQETTYYGKDVQTLSCNTTVVVGWHVEKQCVLASTSKCKVPNHSDRNTQENSYEHEDVHRDGEEVSRLVYLRVNIQNLSVTFEQVHHSRTKQWQSCDIPGFVLQVFLRDLNTVDLLGSF